jgi:hypothetical protein
MQGLLLLPGNGEIFTAGPTGGRFHTRQRQVYEYIGVSVPKMEAISPEKLRHGSIFTLVNYMERSGPFPGVN